MKRSILIVDDTEPNRLLLGAIVSSLGFTPIFAEDGEEAVETFAAERPVCAIVDQIMPLEHGADAVKRMRLIMPDFIAILTSALADPDDIAALVASCGADDFLPRPFNADTVRALLEKHRLLP